MASAGRIGNPQMSLNTDPRVNKGLLKALIAHGMQHNAFLSTTLTPDATIKDKVAFARHSEREFEAMIAKMRFEVDQNRQMPRVSCTDVSIFGCHDNDIRLTIYRQQQMDNQYLPGVIYFHGGGMVMLNTKNKLHTSYAQSIAELGLIAILVDFRNVLRREDLPNTEGIPNYFPAGLEDCVSATDWVYKNASALGISKIILHGDSGGANLALATALWLNKQQKTYDRSIVPIVDGVFVIDPYISGAYHQSTAWKLLNLPSLVECDGYDVSCAASAIYAALYNGEEGAATAMDSLAWPYWATEDAMRGLPAHFITVAELDPLRDEGREYWKKLERAGVRCQGKVRKGVTHTAELLFRGCGLEKEFVELLCMLKNFAESV
ncbi:hypothetical protein CB0940_10854 [Cercospora beticola]|uniref:Alpha/beta hydrolase fold-3 domain-containing protein n=1 Tax=Cercospora beticola TaxID=122368 RepID=A0A2G5HTY9_CERBT|nr:hypothetical protein CB0940_10854 [Cercospora beticola]PIA96007.1 hypothetical protein CB0940_10854 [Cercospora beticola]WPB07586.1 hypothetical protein RHO25_012247 [Cercospora beticola]